MKCINILAALALVLFIGCGGSSEKQPSENSADQGTEMTEDIRTIEITGIDQMKFVVENKTEGISVSDSLIADSLMEIKGITAEPGEQIRIQLTTQSKMPPVAMAHNWLLLTMDADVEAFAMAALKARDNDYVPAEMEDQVIAQTGLVAGGETAEVTFTAPEEPGEYEFICTFPGHFNAGMRGTLTVEQSATPPSE